MTHYDKRFPLWKRIMDISLVVLSFPVTIPLALMIITYIKLVSSGPVLFKQIRIGLDCKPFICYKFRSMYVDSSIKIHESHFKSIVQNNVPMTKIDTKDNRLIPGAKWLRSIGLDELPQLLNVLRGNMSLVGPRPCLAYEFQYFQNDGIRRFNILPGLTGLWQVSGKNNTTFQEMVSLDVFYADRYNLFMDIKIVLSTLPVMISQLVTNIK